MAGRKLSFTAADVREMAKRFSNWGRFGADDELGTVNFITPEKRRPLRVDARGGASARR